MSERSVTCPTCFYAARWSSDGEELERSQEGGGREPSGHPTLATWRIWSRARSGETGPVVGRCPQCDLPVLADDGASDPAWTLQTPRGPVVVGADVLRGPQGALTDAAAEAFFAEQFQPDPIAELFDFRLIFVALMIGVIVLIALFWLGAGLFVANFLYAMGTQGNFSAPSVP